MGLGSRAESGEGGAEPGLLAAPREPDRPLPPRREHGFPKAHPDPGALFPWLDFHWVMPLTHLSRGRRRAGLWRKGFRVL